MTEPDSDTLPSEKAPAPDAPDATFSASSTSHINAAPRAHSFYVAILVLLTLIMSLPGISAMPVIDRDEARYAQASVQMVESGNYLDIKFQDRARNKKPAGIYWMQAASVKALTRLQTRAIWAHRIVSVLGAILAVLATYWAGVIIFGRRTAFWSAALLATSLLMVFESHIAKTDAMLCGLSAIVLASLVRLRQGPSRRAAFLFWAALGFAVMVKGPITPALTVLTILALLIWERDISWAKSLINWPGIVAAFFITVPWAVIMWAATDGAFFKEAIGGDLTPKLMGGQETHGAPPGYYILTLPLFFWPAILFLASGFVFAFKALRADDKSARLKKHVRFLLCWIIPFWLVLELVPTKLPNYLLPAYPALALLCGGALLTLMRVPALRKSFALGAVLFGFVSILLISVIFSAWGAYAPNSSYWQLMLVPLLVFLVFAVVYYCFKNRLERALIAGLTLAVFVSGLTYQFMMPSMKDLRLSDQIASALTDAGIHVTGYDKAILSPHFTEPSLVYHLGTDIVLGDKAQTRLEEGLRPGDVLIIDALEAGDAANPVSLSAFISEPGLCLNPLGDVSGLNYSKGDRVDIHLYRVAACP